VGFKVVTTNDTVCRPGPVALKLGGFAETTGGKGTGLWRQSRLMK
jgi:hypothetical protein